MKLEDIENPDFWHRMLPSMSITDKPFENSAAEWYKCDAQVDENMRLRMIEDGYFQTPALVSPPDVNMLRDAVLALGGHGAMPLFLALFDDYWKILYRLRSTFTSVLGQDYRLIPDFWIWNIDTEDSATGWQPHRDGAMFNDSIRADGSPTLCTVWLALTDVETTNSCMYALPRKYDALFQDFVRKRFGQPGIPDADKIPLPLNRIRALPIKAGAMLGWDTNLLHWGSGSSKWAEGPRVSTGVYYQAADSSKTDFPVFDDDGRQSVDCMPDTVLDFEQRLTILANIIGTYIANFDEYGENEPFLTETVRQFAEKWRRN